MALKPNTQTGMLSGRDHGTNDDLTGSGGPLYGDALQLFDAARGGNDLLRGGIGLTNGLLGDALDMFDHTRGGNDVLIGGDGPTADNTFLGDAANLYGNAHGGNDLLIGGAGAIRNIMNADGFLHDHTIGGNDVLIGGDGATINRLRGDGLSMEDHAVGGNDILIAGNGAGTTNELRGDARFISDFAVCGNDILISGNAVDSLWGDGGTGAETGPNVTTGTDTFVFMPGNNADAIFDFRQTDHDRIDLSAFGFDDIGNLNISVGSDTVIDFGGGNSVTLVGFTDPLTASDFIF